MSRAVSLLGTLLATAVVVIFTPAVASAADTSPPVIKHTPVTKVTRGENLIVMAHMKDDSAIFGATLWYRAPNTTLYASAEMIRKGEDLWGASIPVTSDIEYYIEAYDEFGNGPSWAGSPKTPFLVKIADAAPVYEADKNKKEEEVPDKVVLTKPDDSKTTGDNEDLSLPSTYKKTAPARDDDDLSAPPVKAASTEKVSPFDPAAPTTPQEPVYKQWWFIGGAGVIAVAAITTAVILLQPQPVDRNVFGTGLRTQ
jgi:hypothetical protein